MDTTLRREMEVAFSRHSQSIRFRVAKWIVLIGSMYLVWDTPYVRHLVSLFLVAGIVIHLLWRYKTRGWTQSWIGWDYEKTKPKKTGSV